MTWQNPWAWGGIAAIALPVLIHLLSQQRARRLRFPTLRFVGDSRPLPIRRTQLRDLMLLAVRVGIIAAAVAALAQPLLQTASRSAAVDGTLVRAVIIDKSASMLRKSVSGEPAIVVAQRLAVQLANSAQVHTILMATTPAAAIPGAVSWLARQSGRAELVIVSDFQGGMLDASNIASIPARIGIHLVPVKIAPTTEPVIVRSAQGEMELDAQVAQSPEGDAVRVDWRAAGPAASIPPGMLIALTGTDEAAPANAATLAARSVAIPLPIDTTHAVAIVYPHAAERSVLLRHAQGLHMAWMTDLVARLRADSMLANAAATATLADTNSGSSAFVVGRTRTGQPAVLATEAFLRGADRLVLFPMTDAGSVTSAALIAATTRALSLAPPTAELDPASIPDSELASWNRPTGAATASNSDTSDGRWLWMLALILLGVETLLRRSAPAIPPTAPIRDNAL